ncbi:MAG: SIR2 family protein [Fuerstiella sp.]
MALSQDPQKQIGYLQQCLSSDKRPLGLFLGAGCPMSIRSTEDDGGPLIPDIAGITRIVRDELSQCSECQPLLATIDEHFETDGKTDPTVEDMLSHIRSLRTVAGNGEVRGLSGSNLDTMDERICGIIHRVVDKPLPTLETPYHRVSSWVDAIRRENPIEVFTTNYDLLMEQAFEEHRVPYFDGFAGVRMPFFDLRSMEEDMLPPRWARLWKLHGSINWYQEPGKGVYRAATQPADGVTRVIHPSHLKYEESRRMPYLAMLDRLRAFLKQPTATLVICGYSFGDEHLNEVLVQGLQCTQTTVAFALLFGGLEDYSQAAQLARGRSNLTLLARNGAVVSGQKGEWVEKPANVAGANDEPWVTWSPPASGETDGPQIANFQLGDFAKFGSFLNALVGSVRQIMEPPDAS